MSKKQNTGKTRGRLDGWGTTTARRERLSPRHPAVDYSAEAASAAADLVRMALLDSAVACYSQSLAYSPVRWRGLCTDQSEVFHVLCQTIVRE